MIMCSQVTLYAQHLSLKWTSLTAVNEIQDICISGDRIWAATSGGLRSFNQMNEHQDIWTNTEHLTSNNLRVVAPDLVGGIWIGHNNGIIQHYDPKEDRWSDIRDFENHPVHSLMQAGDTLWVGLDIGISLYLLDRDEVKETYRNLGSLPVDLPVHSLVIFNNKIWAATDYGIASADLSITNLLDPASWNVYTEDSGLLQKDISKLVATSMGIAAGGSKGITILDNEEWEIVYQGAVYDLIAHSELLVAATGHGVREWNGNQWASLDNSGQSIRQLGYIDNEYYGSKNRGFFRLKAGVTVWEELPEISLNGNLVSSISKNSNGDLWCTLRDGGISSKQNEQWQAYHKDNSTEITQNDWYASAIDPAGNIWTGSWGQGVIKFSPDGEMTLYNSDNSVLSGIFGNANYVVITKLYVDKDGTLWICNYRADDGNPIIAVDSQGNWTEYGWSEGIGSDLVRDIVEDGFGRMWIATEIGLYCYDDRGTPANIQDDGQIMFFTTAHGLASNNVKALSAAQDGTIYAGTSDGINMIFDTQISSIYGLPVKSVNTILIDGAGTLWAGTLDGLAHLDHQSYTWTLFQTEDGLANNNVNTLSMDYDQGILYIGTNGGLSIVETPFSRASKTLEDLKIYPNPFLPHEHHNVTIDRVGENVAVSIFTSSGYEVRHFDAADIFGSRLTWDGKDDKGQELPSGIYVVTGVNDTGKTQKGALTLIR